MAVENFRSNTLIIPMGIFYQNNGMFKAYGLVYKLLTSGIPVKWAIRPGKSFDGTDFTASARDLQTAALIVNYNYRGGSFIIDSAYFIKALAVVTLWQKTNPDVTVHRATAPFSADIAATMTKPPRIALEALNYDVIANYLNTAGIPDSNGDIWSSTSPGILTEEKIAQGAFFENGPAECRRIAYDIFLSLDTGNFTWNDPILKTELNNYLYQGGCLHAMCESVPIIENTAGPFLTLEGILAADINKGDANTFTVDIPDFPSAQGVGTGAAQELPGGAFETVYHLAPGLAYNPQTQVIAYFMDDSKQYDFMMAGPYKNGAGAGMVIYEGGYDYCPSLPYAGSMANLYCRFVLDSIFFSITKPLISIEILSSAIYQDVINTIYFRVVNTGASPAVNRGFSVNLVPGMFYNRDATIPPDSIAGQTLAWSSEALGTAPPGTVLTFTADFMPRTTDVTRLADFSASFDDNFDGSYSLDSCLVVSDIIQLDERAGLSAVKTVDLDCAEHGYVLTYTVTITSTGALPALNVVFTDPIPDGASFVKNSVYVNGSQRPGADPSAPGGISLGTIYNEPCYQDTAIVSFQVEVNDNEPLIDIVNQAAVNYCFFNPAEGCLRSQDVSNQVITHVEKGGLTVLKSVNKSMATIGDTITYTAVVTNTGTVAADNVVFIDNLPLATAFVPGSVYIDEAPQPFASPIDGISLGSIFVGGSVNISFEANVTYIPDPPLAENTSYIEYTCNICSEGHTGSSNSNPVITRLVSPILGVIKSSDKTTAGLGETITYTVKVNNSGDVNAENVVLTDPVPEGTNFVFGSVTVVPAPVPPLPPDTNPEDGIPLGNIPAGGSAAVSFKATAVSLPKANPTPNTAVAKAIFKIEPAEPPRPLNFDSNTLYVKIEGVGLSAVKSVDKAYAEVGDTLSYTIVINNTGTIVADNVAFTDYYPEEFTFVPGSVTVEIPPAPPVTVWGDPRVGSIAVGSIPGGSFATVTFQVTIDAIPVHNPAENIGTIDADFPIDPDNPIHKTLDTNPASTRVEIARNNIYKSVDKSIAEVGDIFTYTMTITNVGTVPANGAVLTDIVPKVTIFVPGSVTINGNQSGTNPAAGIPVGNIPAGGTVTVTFNVQATSSPVPNPAVNIATLSAQYPVNPQSPVTKEFKSNPVETRVETAVVNVVKTVDKAYAEVGDVLTYTTTITNPGTVPATTVVFTDAAPNGFNFVPGSVTVNGFPNAGNPSAGITLTDIPVGGSVTVAFQATVDAIPVPNPSENIGTISALFPINPNEPPVPKDFETNPVNVRVEIARLNVIKTVDSAFAEVCQNLAYTITVTNTGTVAANNVVVTDPPPNGTSFLGGTVTVNGIPAPTVNPSTGINIGTLPAGESVVITFKAHADFVPVPNPARNISIVSGSFQVNPTSPLEKEFESNPADTRIEIARLNMVKNVDKPFVELGDTLTYTVSVSNTGTVPANNVVFTDTPPKVTSFVPGSVTINGIPNEFASPVTGVSLGTIPVGGTVNVAFKALTNSIPTPNPTINFGAAKGSFPVNPNNPVEKEFESNPVPVEVELAQLGVVKTGDKSFAEVGETVTYTVTITNTGTVPANNVVFTDAPPDGTVFVPGSITVNGVPVPGDPASGIPIGTIPAGGTVTVAFQVTVVFVPAPDPNVNVASVDASFIIDPTKPSIELDFPSNPFT